MSKEEFILVNRRKKRKKFVKVDKTQLSLTQFDEYEFDKDFIKRTIIDAGIKLKGRFSQHRSSVYQLALVLLLRRNYNCQVSIYDPAFLPKEIEILQEFHCNLIENNEECKRTISNNVTFIYMPHCPRQLINNFLYSNWSENLSNCVLVTNSFSDIVEQSLKWHLMTFAKYILRIYPYMTEIKLENDFEFVEVFYATSIHIFSEEKLKQISADFWLDKETPQYPSKYIEFTPADKTNTTPC
ncbi:PREDICTED: SRR1-like protein isoform X2 [Polistes dominula]|uniref:SRR1-like protein isoform X2 n=1 Tax=Polistes dominula TaxID=743375 RepID=A0ABM1IGN9_POLDO|nr:PREDICTED: SRR1-like protein isoform X2 [Polistes dominula]